MPISEESVYEALRQVKDPELLVNVVDLGLIYGLGLEESDGGMRVHVIATMTTPACPYGPQLVADMKDALLAIEGVREATVQVTLAPPWTPDRMTEEARDELGIF
jgi:metal-sulfur cluster biosynthetic enzyme